MQQDYSNMIWQDIEEWFLESGYDYAKLNFDLDKDKHFGGIWVCVFAVQSPPERNRYDFKVSITFDPPYHDGTLSQKQKEKVFKILCKLYLEPEKLVFHEEETDFENPVDVFGREVYYWHIGDKHAYLQEFDNGIYQLNISYKPYELIVDGTGNGGL